MCVNATFFVLVVRVLVVLKLFWNSTLSSDEWTSFFVVVDNVLSHCGI